MEKNNIHATLISFKKKGILFIGKSGSGKSDLALRMIMEKGAKLVADDRVDIEVKNNELIGKSPTELLGKIEVRGIGILSVDALSCEKISLCVELCSSRQDVERFPEQNNAVFLGIEIPKIRLYAFDCSTICKIIAKICGIIC